MRSGEFGVKYGPSVCAGVGSSSSAIAGVAASTVSGSIAVKASATDDIGVTGVQFRVDGANLGAEDTTAPYEASWDTTSAANGNHVLTVVSFELTGASSMRGRPMR